MSLLGFSVNKAASAVLTDFALSLVLTIVLCLI